MSNPVPPPPSPETIKQTISRERSTASQPSGHSGDQGEESTPAQQSRINFERERELRLRNDAREQIIKLKGDSLRKLFFLFFLQWAGLTIFILLQGLQFTPDDTRIAHPWFVWKFVGFQLENPLLEIYTGATIIQISSMLYVAVKHLFPSEQG